MFIPDPDFYLFRIPDLGSRIQKQQQKRGMKKNLLSNLFFLATNFTKLKINFFLNAEEKNVGQFSKNYRTFYFFQGNANTANTGTITQEHIKASILSAVEDKVLYLYKKWTVRYLCVQERSLSGASCLERINRG
jgi:hypothetical protein